MFYLQDCLTVQKGEKLSGTFGVRQNASNKVMMGEGVVAGALHWMTPPPACV